MLNWLRKIDDWQPLTILKARLEVVLGILFGGVAAIDWSQLISLGSAGTKDWEVFAITSGILLTHGIVQELMRRFNAKDI